MNGPRFTVSVTHGDRDAGGGGNTGRSPNACAYVYDRLCDKMVFSYPTETTRPDRGYRRRSSVAEVTRMADERCAELNSKQAAA